MQKESSLNALFPDRDSRLRQLRAEDETFDEICGHFELLIEEMTRRFGAVDQSTTDLIASFDDLRRDIERRLNRASERNK